MLRNRGILYGPWLPIYGIGALGIYAMKPIKKYPLLMTLPLGAIFGQVYEIWNLAGLSGGKAMETAVMIFAAIAGIYVLYFIITYRIACDHVICYGNERKEAL